MKRTLQSLMTLVFFVCSIFAQAQKPLPVCKLKAKFDFKTENCFVKFADLSAAAVGTTITNWSWDFGDATSSTLQNPTHSYAANGTYTVCLTIVGVNNATGLKCKDKFCLPVTIEGCQTLPCKLAAKFDFKIDGCNVGFTDYSAAAAGTTITSWHWDFGDGNTSNLQNPSHLYTSSGVFNVCLTIVGVNAAGVKCKDKICQTITLQGCGQAEPCKLAPKFEFKVEKCNVYFHDLSVAGAGTTITNWYWDFGDATTSTSQHPSHTYITAGTYTVCLVIVGINASGEQCKEKYCTKVTVDGCGTLPCGVKPLFDFKVDKCTVYFTDMSGTNPGTTITSWNWSFGDATTSTLQSPTHTYAANATYTVCLTTYAVNTNGEECKNTYCFPVKVDGCGQVDPCGVKPLFDFKIDKCTVYFTDLTGTNTGTTITSWNWNFGDGNISNLQNPTHAYAANGTYNVCLTVYAVNAAGVECKNTYCKEVKVSDCGQVEPCGVKPSFDAKVEKCVAYFLNNTVVNPGTSITSWYWSFGDGTTSTSPTPTHTYTINGTYTVCLTAYGVNAAGQECKDTYCKDIIIDGCWNGDACSVTSKFSYKLYKCEAMFSDFSVAGPGTTITNWYWDFGDGNTSTVQNPTHSYAASGWYTVCLTVVGTTASGEQCKNQYCQKIYVTECNPIDCNLYPKFDFKVEKCIVYFTDYSSVGTGTTITNWYWDFGDGTTSTLQNPTHPYTISGTYTVCLTIVGVNPSGQQCKEQLCMEVKVGECGDPQPCKLTADFGFKPADKCLAYFNDYSVAAAGTIITNWDWDFGDGTTSSAQHPSHTYAASGTYLVCLVVVGTNAAGEECKDKRCIEIKVEGCGTTDSCKIGAKFDYKADKCNVYFTDYSAAGTGTSITKWYWEFGDGTTSVLQNPTHTYTASGTYTVCLTVFGTNAAGQQCKDRYCVDIKVEGCNANEPCKVAAKYSYKTYKCDLYLSDFSAAGAGSVITNWYWDFGDGNTSTLQNPFHSYTANGVYTVCLVVVGKNPATGEECKDKYCSEITIRDCDQPTGCIVYPKFDFKTDKCTVYFTDYSGTVTGTSITNWYWEFGDGGTSTLQNPSHTYATAGTYEVCLIVVGKNAVGQECKDRICLKVTVMDCAHKEKYNIANISSLQVYPNPALDIVNIEFKMETAGQVNIIITDIQGRVLSVIQDGNLTAGFHKLNWNVDVRSGLYFITIKTDAGIEQKQIVIQE